MENAQEINYHVPPMIIFLFVVLSCLIIGFLIDFIMQKYGCCGREGGCCRPEIEGDEANVEGRGAIPMVPLRTNHNRLPGRLPLLSRAPHDNSNV
uniref:Uncharacterized protein n=1 Tax=Caenorhabditis tropicalis TaxID=1561998 RepID=A0A1I7TID5_9PELO